MQAIAKFERVVLLSVLVVACANSRTPPETGTLDSIKVSPESGQQQERTVSLLETVLNLPDVIRYSKTEFIRKKYGKVYLLVDSIQMGRELPAIVQSGKKLEILFSKDSLSEDMPCYVFRSFSISGDTATVDLDFEITGAIAYGKLIYSDNKWITGSEFFVGVQ